jgi:hypothetical protein
MAARSGHEVVVLRRDGQPIGRARVPDLDETLRDRLAPVIARWFYELPLQGPLPESAREEYEAILAAVDYEEILEMVDIDVTSLGEAGSLLRPGALIRTEGGRLAVDPVLDIERLYAEEEGCTEVLWTLRVPIEVPGLAPAPCSEPSGRDIVLSIDPGAPAPEVWRCTLIDDLSVLEPPAGSAEEAWGCAVRGSEAIVNDERCGLLVHGQSVESVVACHLRDEARWVLAVSQVPFMGCGWLPALFVIEGCRVVADTGFGGRIRQVGGVRLYGGGRAWYLHEPGGPLVPIGVTEPDVVVVPRGANPGARSSGPDGPARAW